MSTDAAKFGILSTNLDKQTYCRESAIWDVKSNEGKTHCTDYMDASTITNQINKCNGKSTCEIDF